MMVVDFLQAAAGSIVEGFAFLFGGQKSPGGDQHNASLKYEMATGAVTAAASLAHMRELSPIGHSNGVDAVIFGGSAEEEDPRANQFLEKYSFAGDSFSSVSLSALPDNGYKFLYFNLAVGPAEFVLLDFVTRYTYADDSVIDVTASAFDLFVGGTGLTQRGDAPWGCAGNIATTAYATKGGDDNPGGPRHTYLFADGTITETTYLPSSIPGNCSFSSQTDSYFRGFGAFARYHYADDTTTAPSAPTAVLGAGACSSPSGGWVFGGETSQSLVERYDFVSETWAAETALSSADERFDQAVVASSPGNI